MTIDPFRGIPLILVNRRHSGVSQLTIAAPEGAKMELAKSLDAGDFYVPLSRSNPAPQWEKIKKDNPYGFDIGESVDVFEHWLSC